jgi:hypothetical protein
LEREKRGEREGAKTRREGAECRLKNAGGSRRCERGKRERLRVSARR